MADNDMHNIAKLVTRETCRVLQNLLPTIGGSDWWNTCVVAKLSYQQQERVERSKISSLDKLDLAALTRILDKNWHEVSDKAGFSQDARTLVRELQNIRNRMAHIDAGEIPLQDQYRDLDTIHRYLGLLGSDPDALGQVDGARRSVLQRMAAPPPAGSPPPPANPPQPDKSGTAPVPPTSTPAKQTAPAGVPLELLGKEAANNDKIKALLKKKSFIGIDFGTSTTTASLVVIDEESGALTTQPIPIKQYDADGICIEDHLVPTCIAWTGSALLVGQGAARFKSEYEYGKNIWFSFKMKLGMDLGPQYSRSELARTANGPVVIEKPQHAAAVFFRYLREKIESYIKARNLPATVAYSVSVPAAFEANQRKDLCDALGEAGIVLPAHGIVDEPNAAFISYLLDTLRTGTGIAQSMREHKRNVLVFDFGAGTCDISILEVGAMQGRFTSKNKAISQFHALGGDNIDRQLVRELLLPQLFAQSKPAVDFNTSELDIAIVPRLQQAAEDMKVQCCKFVASKWDGRNVAPFAASDHAISGKSVPTFRVRNCELKLNNPTISLKGFAEVMRPFVDPSLLEVGIVHREDDIISIFEPIDNALRKANITPDDLHMVLFIGGSSLNPYVQGAIHERFGRFVECVLPGDLRTPVSRGAAINAFMVNGLGCEVIRPITSETIYVVTAGGGLHEILPAGTEMPSADIFVGDLEVQRDGQPKVELPICVSNEDKLLGTIEIPAQKGRPFKKGESVTLVGRLDENKLLLVKAKVGSQMVAGLLMNPLSNEEVTPAEARMLLARHAVNLSALENGGRPSVQVMLNYAYACAAADHFLQAAEAFEAVERLDMSKNFATDIAYYYSKAGKPRLFEKWAAIAHQRHPTAITAFNLALTKRKQQDLNDFVRLMEEAISLDPDFASALEIYGHHLKERGNPKGIDCIEAAFKQFKEEFDHNTLAEDDLHRLRRAASTLGRQDVVRQVDLKCKDLSKREKTYDEGNLAASKRLPHALEKKEK